MLSFSSSDNEDKKIEHKLQKPSTDNHELVHIQNDNQSSLNLKASENVTINPNPSNKRAHSEEVLVAWLKEHFEESSQDTIARDYLYSQYCSFCQDILHTQNMNAASLGKVMRSVFPGLSTRRLGARGQSKYHYNNIRLRHTSTLPRTEDHGTIYSAQVPSRLSYSHPSFGSSMPFSQQQRRVISSAPKGVSFDSSPHSFAGGSSVDVPVGEGPQKQFMFAQDDGSGVPYSMTKFSKKKSDSAVGGAGAGNKRGPRQANGSGKRSLEKHHPYALSSSGLAAAAVLESVANSAAPSGAFTANFVSPTVVYGDSPNGSGEFLESSVPHLPTMVSDGSKSQVLQMQSKMASLNETYQKYTSHVSSLMYSNQMDAVPEVMANFWNHFPSDMAVFLHHHDCIYQLESLEHILHSSVLNSFDSVLLEKLHPRLLYDIEHFATHFSLWESIAIDGKVPKRLQETLLNAAQVFEASLKHRLATNKFLESFQRQIKPLTRALAQFKVDDVINVLQEPPSLPTDGLVMYKSLVELILLAAPISQYANLIVNVYLQHMTGVPCEEEPFRMRSRGFWLVVFDHFQQAASLLLHCCSNSVKAPTSALDSLTRFTSQEQVLHLTSALHSLLQFLLYYAFLVTEKGIAQNFKNLPERYGACADFINAGVVAQMTPLEDLSWVQFIQRAVTTAITFENNTAVFTKGFKNFMPVLAAPCSFSVHPAGQKPAITAKPPTGQTLKLDGQLPALKPAEEFVDMCESFPKVSVSSSLVSTSSTAASVAAPISQDTEFHHNTHQLSVTFS